MGSGEGGGSCRSRGVETWEAAGVIEEGDGGLRIQRN